MKRKATEHEEKGRTQNKLKLKPPPPTLMKDFSLGKFLFAD